MAAAYCLDMRSDYRPVNRGHNQHCEWAAHKALLVLHVLVAGKKHVKAFALYQREQRAVLDAAPLHADDRRNVITSQGTGQFARHVLIEKYLQGCAR